MAEILWKHWRSRGTSWTVFTWSSISRIAVAKTIRGSAMGTWFFFFKKKTIWECLLFVVKTRVISVSICGRHQNGWKEAECGTDVEEINEKTLILTNQHHFLTMYVRDVLNVNANLMKQLLNDIQRCLNHVFLLEQLKNYRGGKSLTQKQWRGPTTGKDMLENALSDTVNWQTRKWSSLTMFQVLAWMMINSSRKNSKQLEKCQKFAHKLSWNACTWRESEDIPWSVNKLARSVTKWTQACDRRLARLISYIHHTSEFRQYCHVEKEAQRCRWYSF